MTDSLRDRLEVLNEAIYEPEGRMAPGERSRLMATRDTLFAQIEACEGDVADCARCEREVPKAEIQTILSRCGWEDFCTECALEINDSTLDLGRL